MEALIEVEKVVIPYLYGWFSIEETRAYEELLGLCDKELKYLYHNQRQQIERLKYDDPRLQRQYLNMLLRGLELIEEVLKVRGVGSG